MSKTIAKVQLPSMWIHDLSHSERRFLLAMNDLQFGRFEFLRIEQGELVLNPWPTTVRAVKIRSEAAATQVFPDDFELKPPSAEFFKHVRAMANGEIRCLEVRHGLPFSMELTYRPNTGEARRD